MTQRAAHPPQDFQKMCKQAERDHETKKLVVLIERVKRQLAERGTATVTEPKPPLAVMISDGLRSRKPSRSSIFER
ncbi:MAG TPA: hypothetical protein VIW68_01010 [Candidatus Sulfotelmatobacter sp.]